MNKLKTYPDVTFDIETPLGKLHCCASDEEIDADNIQQIRGLLNEQKIEQLEKRVLELEKALEKIKRGG